MYSVESCRHCGEIVPVNPRGLTVCPSCGHHAHVPRLLCRCPACVRPEAAGLGVDVDAAVKRMVRGYAGTKGE